MDSFEYLIALVSVIAGLGIARALSGLARLLNARRTVTVSWIPICWTFSVLLWLVAFWWFTFLLSISGGLTPGILIFVLTYASLIFLLLALLHPDNIDSGFDNLEYFLDNRRPFFGALLIVALVDLADTWYKHRNGLSIPSATPYAALMSMWIAMSAAAIFVRNRTFHAVFAVIFLAAMVLWQRFSLGGILEEVAGAA